MSEKVKQVSMEMLLQTYGSGAVDVIVKNSIDNKFIKNNNSNFCRGIRKGNKGALAILNNVAATELKLTTVRERLRAKLQNK